MFGKLLVQVAYGMSWGATDGVAQHSAVNPDGRDRVRPSRMLSALQAKHGELLPNNPSALPAQP